MTLATRLAPKPSEGNSTALVRTGDLSCPAAPSDDANPIEYELHLGVHDVFPSLIEEAAQALSAELRAEAVYVVDSTEFRRDIRPALVDPAGSPESSHISDFTLPNGTRRVVLSAHGILCDKKHIFGAKGLYPRVQTSLANVARYFSDTPLSIHLSIVPQHNFRPIADSPEATRYPLSWLPLIEEILKAFPGTPITLWPVERAEVDAVPFIEDVFGLDLNAAQSTSVAKIASGQRIAAAKSAPTDALSPSSVRLDQAFCDDMIAVQRHKSVIIGIARVSDEFSL